MLMCVWSVTSKIAYNESVFAMAGYSVFRHADTEVDFCFIVEDTFCCLIINGRVGKGISAQASHKTVLDILTTHGFSYSA